MARIAGQRVRSGLAIVEAVLVMPLLLLLTFGAMEYGWMFVKAHEINNAARQGARVAVRADATAADVDSALSAFMTAAGMPSPGYSRTITPGVTVETGATVTVEVVVPYAGTGLELIGMPLLPVPVSLRASVSMAKEGP